MRWSRSVRWCAARPITSRSSPMNRRRASRRWCSSSAFRWAMAFSRRTPTNRRSHARTARATTRCRRRWCSRPCWKRSMRSSPRRRAREFVLQGLYQQQLSSNADEAIRAQLTEASGFSKADAAYFAGLWSGVGAEYDTMLERIGPYLDRPVHDLSPIERSILVIGAWELLHRLDIPYR